MANTSAGTLITRALDNASRLGTTATKSGTTLSNFGIDVLNRVMFRIAREHDFRELKGTYTGETADGTKTYAIDSTFSITPTYKNIYDLRLIDGSSSIKLEHMERQVFDESVPYPENSTEGRPHWYTPYGNNIDLYPIPDYASTALTGSIDPTASTTVLGVGTLFTTELTVGDLIRVSDVVREVATIVSDTELTVTVAYTNLDNDTAPEKVTNYTMYLRCSVWPTVITATTDLVTFSPDKDDLLVYGMTEELFSLLQMHEDSAVWSAKYQRALRDAIDVDGKYPDWNPVGRGFNFSRDRYVGDPWLDPFVRRNL